MRVKALSTRAVGVADEGHLAAAIDLAVHGVEQLRRRLLVTALGQSRQPKTADALYTLARTDPDAAVRAEAVHWYARQASAGVLGNVMGIIMGDTEDVVRRRAVSSLGLIAADNGVPALIQLARTGPSPVIRKEAVSTLARTTCQSTWPRLAPRATRTPISGVRRATV